MYVDPAESWFSLLSMWLPATVSSRDCKVFREGWRAAASQES